MTHITGATKAEALAAEVKSAPNLLPTFAVFHCNDSSVSNALERTVGRPIEPGSEEIVEGVAIVFEDTSSSRPGSRAGIM